MNVEWRLRRLDLIAVLVLVLVGGAPAAALGSEPEAHHDGYGEGGGEHQNHFTLFGGLTRAEHDSGHGHVETLEEVTFGFDYERRWRKSVGFGFLADHASGDLDSTVIAPAMFIHPADWLTLTFAPGIEVADEHEEFLMRLGVAVGWHVGRMLIGPSVAVDWVDGEEIWLGGLQVGFGF